MYKFTAEQKYDVAIDIAEPYFAILSDPEIQKLQKANAPVTAYTKPALKNHKKEVLEMLARLQSEEGITVQEYLDKVGILAIPVEFMQLLTSPDFNAVFSVQGQNTDKTSTGSATENIEVEKK